MWIIIQILFNSILGSLLSVLLAANGTGKSVILAQKSVADVKPGDGAPMLSKADLQAIKEFRPLVNDLLILDYEKTNQFLIRYLRAFNFDFEKASTQIRETQAWKKLNDWDTIDNVTFAPKVPLCYFDGSVDKKGNLLIYGRFDDFRKYVMLGHHQDLTRYVLKLVSDMITKLGEMSIGNEEKDFGAMVIFDGSGFNIKQHGCYQCLNLYLEWIKIYEVYFPEVIQNLAVLNAPPIGKPIVEIVKGIMSEHTKKRLNVFGHDQKEWTEFLLKHISPDQLSKRVGGDRDNWY